MIFIVVRNSMPSVTHWGENMPGHFYHIFASQLVFNKQHTVIIDIFYEQHTLHEKLDLHKFTRCKYGAKKCKLGVNQKQRW